MATKTTAGDIVWNVGSDISGLEKGLASAQKQAQKLSDKFGNIAKKTGIAFAAIGGAITAGVAGSVKVWAEAGDEIQKMALRTGFATETLSELKFAAERSGTSLETVEKAAKKMSTVIFEAGEEFRKTGKEGGTYSDALMNIGLSHQELVGLKPEEQFNKIALALADVTDHTTKAALAQELFGRAGVDLLPMLEGGSAGLQALKERAHELGVVFDQEAANKAAGFQDAMLDLKESLKSLAFIVAETIVPSLMVAIEWLTGAIQKVREFTNANPALTNSLIVATAAIGGIMLVLAPILILLPGLVTAFGLFGTALTAISGIFGTTAIAATGASTAIGVTGATATVASGGVMALAGSFLALAAPIAAIVAVLGLATFAINKHIRAQMDLKIAQDQQKASEISLSATIERRVQQLEKQGVKIDRVALATKSMDDQITHLNKRSIEAKMATGEYGETVDESTQQTKSNTTELKGNTGATRDGTGATEGMNRETHRGISINQSLSQKLGLTSQEYGRLAQAAAQAAAEIRNANAASNGGGMANGGVIPGRANGGVIKGYANGGATGIGMARVGEYGSEIAAFPQGTRIISHTETVQAVRDGAKSQGIGTFSPNISINITGAGENIMEHYDEFKGRLFGDMMDEMRAASR